MEKKTPHPSKDYHKHHNVVSKSVKLNKNIMLIASAAVIVVLIGLVFYAFMQKPATASESMIYIYPKGCTDSICSSADIQELMKGSAVRFYQASFVQIPLLMVPLEGELKLIQVQNKASILQGLCSLGNSAYCDEAKKSDYACEGIVKTEKPNLLLFYMSYCPYGQQAFNGIYPVLKLLGNKINFEPHFVIYENYQGGSADYCIDSGKICSMHGISEVNEDIRQACVYKLKGLDSYLEYTNCVMSSCSISNVDECWKTCAQKNSVDVKEIEACKTNDGISLMNKEKQLDKQYGASGSPTIILNGKDYSGGRAPENFKQQICCAFNNAPADCSKSLGEEAAAASGGCG